MSLQLMPPLEALAREVAENPDLLQNVQTSWHPKVLGLVRSFPNGFLKLRVSNPLGQGGGMVETEGFEKFPRMVRVRWYFLQRKRTSLKPYAHLQIF